MFSSIDHLVGNSAIIELCWRKAYNNTDRLSGKNAHLVTYGAMAKEALIFPSSVFIFNDLTAHGFWKAEWYKQKSPEKRAWVTESSSNI